MVIVSGNFASAAPTFIPGTAGNSSILTQFTEDTLFAYNLSANVSNQDNEILNFSIVSITSSIHGAQSNSFFSWISINSTNGNLSINSSINNHTGRYNISIQVLNIDPTPSGQTGVFYFNGTALNDKPAFTNLTNQTFQALSLFTYIVLASDEESNTPFNFAVNFTSCVAPQRNNCTLFNISSYNSTALLINFTPVLL